MRSRSTTRRWIRCRAISRKRSIAGVAGNGQGELFDVLSGEYTVSDNEAVKVRGKPVGHSGISARRLLGAAFVPEERHGHGAVTAMSLSDNLVLSRNASDRKAFLAGGALKIIRSSTIDLALYLIGRFCGAEEAARIARLFVIGDRRDGQLPFAAMTRPRQHGNAAIADVQTWLADNYASPNPVTAMVARSGMAERTFKRQFKAATGYAPVDYVQAMRIEEAKQMLETEPTAIEDIAVAVGYEDRSCR